jgi:hypothetical protein
MAKYYYYNEAGAKEGPFSGTEIKMHAKAGLIKPETVLEMDDGKKCPARKISGLEFEKNSKPLPVPIPTDEESFADAILSEPNAAISPVSAASWHRGTHDYETTLPHWLDQSSERVDPSGFCKSIDRLIGWASILYWVTTVCYAFAIFCGWMMAITGGGTEGLVVCTVIATVLSVFLFSVNYLSWGLIICFLRFIRASFFNQMAIEKRLEMLAENLKD